MPAFCRWLPASRCRAGLPETSPPATVAAMLRAVTRLRVSRTEGAWSLRRRGVGRDEPRARACRRAGTGRRRRPPAPRRKPARTLPCTGSPSRMSTRLWWWRPGRRRRRGAPAPLRLQLGDHRRGQRVVVTAGIDPRMRCAAHGRRRRLPCPRSAPLGRPTSCIGRWRARAGARVDTFMSSAAGATLASVSCEHVGLRTSRRDAIRPAISEQLPTASLP